MKPSSSSNQAPNPMAMDSLLVIKVKYGDTIRRFTAYVDENTLCDLDMAKLKNKIHTLFDFPDNADLTLTYTDEDKDEITLVDDNDLYDATAQKLNPLRITVVTNRERRPARLVSMSSARVVSIPRPARLVSTSSASNGNKSKKNSGGLGSFNRDHVNNGRACHIGIHCDGCRVYPIMGPRFKSKVKEDYDLCNICIAHRGNEADYIQIDVPVSVKLQGFSKNFNDVDASLVRPRAVKVQHSCVDGTQAMNNYALPETGPFKIAAEAVNPKSAIDKGRRKNQLLEFSLHNGSSIPDAASVPVTPVVCTHASNPVFESSFVQSEPSTGVDASSMEVDLEYELMLLDALEGMGFKQIELNKEILRDNEFDLNQSISDLCDMCDWEEILNELDDMGFCDKEMNIKLLKKNEGNIKKVVMSLLSGKTE